MIAKKPGCYRYYVLDGHEISNIIFYKSGKELLHIPRGWLEYRTFINNQPSPDYEEFRDVVSLPLLAIRSKTENLHRHDHFYLGSKQKGYTLYLSADVKTVAQTVEDEGRDIITRVYVQVDLPGVLDNGTKVDSLYLQSQLMVTESEFGKEVREWKEKLDKENIRISTYNLGLLLKHYKLVKR